MLWLFVNWLTADGKYSLVNRESFTQPIQIILSNERKRFSQIFNGVLKCKLNFEYFKKKVHHS